MKKNSLLAALLLVVASGFSQMADISRIVESERKSAAATMNVVVNPNTLNYDVTYHKLEFTVNPAILSATITGKVTTTYTALSNMSTVTFDLTKSGLTVSSVKKGATSLSFVHNTNNELVITLPAVQTAGTSATIEINYSGQPSQEEGSFVRSTHNGQPIIWTLSEPFGARDWWPCKQDLNDKVESIDVYITAPTQYISVSNGLQMGTTISGPNKTTHFHHGYPIPAYLVAIAVSNFSTYTIQAGTAPNNFPIVNYIYPENLAEAQGEIDETVPVMDLYEQLFETYPFSAEKYGHCQFGGGGGMEHTTVSFMDGFDRGLIAHELGHQWFGDKITCGTWKDIWLNEGFATYLSALVIENLDGLDSFVFWKQQVVDYVTEQPGGAVYMTDEEATNSNRIFSQRLSYYKGAMVLEMLRWKLGDANFFQGIKNYLADPALAYKYAITPNLQAHLEAASGMSLSEFFNDWIYKQGYPTYYISAQNIAAGQVEFVVNQIQSHVSVNYFEMPVPVRVYGNGGQQMDVVLDNTFNGQAIIKNIPFAVTSFEFDPDHHLLSRDNSVELGNTNFTLMNKVRLSPNPSANVLNVSIPQNVTLRNATFQNIVGQVVLKTGNETSWDISKLASGVHFLTLVTDAGTKQLKFIKK
jgi:aminopeptidase N